MSSPAAAAPPEAVPSVARQTVLPLVLFCLGHFLVDLYSGALGALQPLLQSRFGLNFTQAGILGGVMVCSASVMQPVYGLLSDRWRSRLFTALAPALAGIFISSLGWAPGYAGLLAMVWIGGVGIASFHPQAAANATARIERNRSGAMAIFICSGTVGLACGPIFFSTLGAHGLALNTWGALPGLLVTLLLLAWMPPLSERPHAHTKRRWDDLRAVWKPLTILYVLVFFRSVVQVTFTQFLPLYLHTQRELLAGGGECHAIALPGGRRDRRIGRRQTRRPLRRTPGHYLSRCSARCRSWRLFVFTTGAISAVALFLGGLFLLFTIPVNVVMAQELAPVAGRHGLGAHDGLRLGRGRAGLHSADRLDLRHVLHAARVCRA